MKKELLKDIISRYEAASFAVDRKLNAIIKDRMPEELTVDQFSTIRYIRKRGKCTSSELSDSFCVGKSSITAIITRLFDKELLERMPDEKDRRVTYLSLTVKGAQLADEMEEKIQVLLASYIKHFDEQEAIQFIETYEKLASVLSKP
ncbi:MarR family winged helix-turn-helix transcriptional regulator [Paenibacillus eucommiae]|uniref:DNA-binding MarR family transcriptional regulator n=1 Tax=Paenibacillus eucommiae TaxID=1355755 RepID=A0ABS4J9Q2_9BACL|nr:MarR family transcriptional regulator [Paenibacillus eucommiae]MBP1996574.1 DNA-binding MarR family transcriptional regulator [Paenibacillus eucommiae]